MAHGVYMYVHKQLPQNTLLVFLLSRLRNIVCKASVQPPAVQPDQYLHRTDSFQLVPDEMLR